MKAMGTNCQKGHIRLSVGGGSWEDLPYPDM